MKKEMSQNRKLSQVISLLMIVLGVILIIYMVVVEGELGALPLFLIVAGTLWFAINRYRIRKQLK